MNAGWWGDAQDQADRPGGGLDGALARLRARADGHDPGISVLDAERIDAELTRLRALAEPADLPATLATVDDVVGVCAAAKLPMRRDIGIAYRWGDGAQVEVIATDMDVDDEPFVVVHAIAGGWIASFKEDTPSSLLWHAIQAARGTS